MSLHSSLDIGGLSIQVTSRTKVKINIIKIIFE